MIRGIILLLCLLGAVLTGSGCDDSPTKQKILKGIENNSPEAEAARQQAAMEMAMDMNSSAAQAAKAVAPAMRSACARCHGMDIVCAKIGKFNLAQWGMVYDDMLERGAAMRSDQFMDVMIMFDDDRVSWKYLCG